jgi:hypothetical protein
LENDSSDLGLESKLNGAAEDACSNVPVAVVRSDL